MTIRKLLPGEIPAYEAHLLRLGAADRAARFHAALSDDGVRTHAARLAWPQTRIVAAVADGTVRGAVELQALDPAETAAELAVSVEPGLQNQGLGTELVRRSLTVARNRAMRQVIMLHLGDNRRMTRLARRLEGTATLGDGGEVETTFVLDPPDGFSLLQELADDGTALFAAGIDLWHRLLRG